jgi:hypothetical protein
VAVNYPIEPRIYLTPKDHTEVGSPFEPTFYLEVSYQMAAFITGLLLKIATPRYWLGTEGEVEAAIQTITEQAARPLLTQGEICGVPLYGADYRIITGDLLQSLQGEGLPPPPWEFRVVPQPDGSVMLQFRTMEE